MWNTCILNKNIISMPRKRCYNDIIKVRIKKIRNIFKSIFKEKNEKLKLKIISIFQKLILQNALQNMED